jgi:hypothetical protein
MGVVLPFAKKAPLATFRIPGPRERTIILGRTGSGKTHFATWLLSHQNWAQRPWFVIDYKHDPLIAEIPVARDFRLTARLPKEPGIYVIHPQPGEDDAVEKLLWGIWRKGRCGVYIDEGHILPDGDALQAILTQGRSKSIPVIAISQRPKWVNRFLFSEADFVSLFHLNDKRDRLTVGEFMPAAATERLPERNSWFYDVPHDRLFQMRPVPGRDSVLRRFDERNPRRMKLRKV